MPSDKQPVRSQIRPHIGSAYQPPKPSKAEIPIDHRPGPAGSGIADFPTPSGVRNSERYLTFQKPLDHDTIASGISKASQRNPVVKLLVPFVRTPMNILKFAAERSPISPLMKEVRADFVAGGVRRDAAVARALVGTGIGATFYAAAVEGRITGGGPLDRDARALMLADGWQPYSMKVGDTYYSYSRLDPYSTIIGTAADMSDLTQHMTDKQRDNVLTLMGASILSNLSNKTWLSGLSGAVEAIYDPGRYLNNFFDRTAGSIAVPGLVAQIARTNDPVLREARGMMARIRSRVPGLSDDLPARRNVFGEAITSEGGVGPDIISPIWKKTAKNDPTIKALLDAGIGISMPQRKDMSPGEYDRYTERTGHILKPNLDALVASPEWKAMDNEARDKAVSDAARNARKAAKEGGWVAPAADAMMSSLPPGFVIDR